MSNPTEAKPELKASRAPFIIADEEIQPGCIGRLALPITRLATGSPLTIPVTVVHGRTDGPCVWISAAIHGDELNGVPVIRRIQSYLNPQTLVGTVILVPVVNVFGLINESRYLPDRRDLNRSFPGSSKGSLASQLADLFMNEVVQYCDVGLDIHAGSAGRSNLPQIRCDLDDERSRNTALLFGAPVTVHSRVRDGSLREAAREAGASVLLYETGEAGRFDHTGIALGVDGGLRVLSGLGMRPDDPPPPTVPATLQSRKTSWVRARRSGFCELSVGLGDLVVEDQRLAAIYDVRTPNEVHVSAPNDGMVIGLQLKALLNRGEAIANIAMLEPSTLG